MNRINWIATRAALLCAALLMATAPLGCSGEGDSSGGGVLGKGDSVAEGAWRDRIDKDYDRLQNEDPKLWRTLVNTKPLATRPGFTRIRGAAVRTPAAASVFLVRYLEERDAPETRAALIEALPRTGGVYEDAIVELYDSESDEQVRAAMMAVLGRSDTAASAQSLAKGLTDRALSVRLEAAAAAGKHPQGGQLGAQLQGLLSDDSAQVRAIAARSLGFQHVATATEALAARLADDDADVRLESLRALARIDAEYLAAQPQAARLQQDDDLRVRRAAALALTRANR